MNSQKISKVMGRKQGWMLVAVTLLFAGCEKRVPPKREASSGMEAVSENIEPAAVVDLLKENADAVVLDVRTPEEFAEGHIEGAINIDFKGDDFDAKIGKLDKAVPYVMHCASGGRSGKSLPKFESLGFKQIYHLEAGFSGWSDAGLPVSK